MTSPTKHPDSIAAALDAPMTGAAVWRSNASYPQWDDPPPDDAAGESPLLTVAQAAEVVPLSAKQLYRVAARPDSPFRKVEGRLMAYADDLHRWIAEHPTGGELSKAPAADGDSLADRVRRRRKGGAS